MKHRASLAVLSLLTLLPVAQANDVTPATGSKSMSFAQLAADAGAHPGVSATPTQNSPKPAPPAPTEAVSTSLVPAPATLTLAQRQAQDELNNAKRLDSVNRDLLADKQRQAIQIEQLQTQVAALRADRSNEGIREGALAVIAGFLMGWFFVGSRRKSW